MPNWAEREIEEAHDKHLIDQERRAKIALQRAINRINVGNRIIRKMNLSYQVHFYVFS